MSSILRSEKIKWAIGIYLVAFFVHFGLRAIQLRNCEFYPGRVTGFETVKFTVRGKRSSGHEFREVPVVQFVTPVDTVTYTDGKFTILTWFSEGEELTVITNRKTQRTTVFSFFYYWLLWPDFILVSLLSFVLYGVVWAFVIQKIHLEE